MVSTARAKIFTNGRSQGVRLPREFRFEGKEAAISQGDKGLDVGRVVPIGGRLLDLPH